MGLELIIGIVACVLAMLALIFGLTGLVFIVGLKNSTHQVQYVPMEKTSDELIKDMNDKMYPDIEQEYV